MINKQLLFELCCEPLPINNLKNNIHIWAELIKSEMLKHGYDLGKAKIYLSTYRIAILFQNVCYKSELDRTVFKGPFENIALKDGLWSDAAMSWSKKIDIDINEADWLEEKNSRRLFIKKQKKQLPFESLFINVINSTVKSVEWDSLTHWSHNGSVYSFLRPVRNIVCLFGEKILEGSLFGLNFSDTTIIDNFQGRKKLKIKITNPYSYESILEKQGVIVSQEKRYNKILDDLYLIAKILDATLDFDEALLKKVSYTFETFKVIYGFFNRNEKSNLIHKAINLCLKDEMLSFSFSKNGLTVPFFALIIQNTKLDKLDDVLKCYQFVVESRINDVEFYYNTDINTPLNILKDRLKNITLHPVLGSISDKVERLKALSLKLAASLNISDIDDLYRAVKICKLDLCSKVVTEMPQLLGIMGGHYAKLRGENERVCLSVENFINPKDSSGDIPLDDHIALIGLIDRLDDVVGIIGVNGPPCGAKDPFAIRRSTIILLRIIIEKKWDLNLDTIISYSYSLYNINVFHSHRLLQIKQYILYRLERLLISNFHFSPKIIKMVLDTKEDNPFKVYLIITSFSNWVINNKVLWKDLCIVVKRVNGFVKKIDINTDIILDKTLPTLNDINKKIVDLNNIDNKQLNVELYDSIWFYLVNIAKDVDRLIENIYFENENEENKKIYFSFFLYVNYLFDRWIKLSKF